MSGFDYSSLANLFGKSNKQKDYKDMIQDAGNILSDIGMFFGNRASSKTALQNAANNNANYNKPRNVIDNNGFQNMFALRDSAKNGVANFLGTAYGNNYQNYHFDKNGNYIGNLPNYKNASNGILSNVDIDNLNQNLQYDKDGNYIGNLNNINNGSNGILSDDQIKQLNNNIAYEAYKNVPLEGNPKGYLSYNTPSQNEIFGKAEQGMLNSVTNGNKTSFLDKVGNWSSQSVGKGGFQTTNGNRVQGIVNTVVDFGTDLYKNLKKDYSTWTTEDMINDAIGGGVGDDPLARAFTGKKRSKLAADELGQRIKYEGTGGMQGANVESSAWDNHKYSNLAMNKTNFGKGFAQYNMDTLNYAKKGFDIGGPWGALIGGIIGSASSLLGHIGEKNRIARLKEAEDKANRKATAMHSNALNVANQRNQLTNLRSMANMASYGGNIIGLKRKDMNYYANGGYTSKGTDINDVVSITTGGTHEENPLGGVPYGKDNQGKQNLVEQGEQIWTDTNGQEFVFSNRIAVPEELKKRYKLKGETFANVVENLKKKNKDLRDSITKRYIDNVLGNLRKSQEEIKANNGMQNNYQEANQYDKGGNLKTFLNSLKQNYETNQRQKFEDRGNQGLRGVFQGNVYNPNLYASIFDEDGSLFSRLVASNSDLKDYNGKVWATLDPDKKTKFINDNLEYFRDEKNPVFSDLENARYNIGNRIEDIADKWRRNQQVSETLDNANFGMAATQFMKAMLRKPNFEQAKKPERYAMTIPDYQNSFTPTYQKYVPQNSNLYNAQLQNDLLSNLNAMAFAGDRSQVAANVAANLGRIATDRANAMNQIYQQNEQQRNAIAQFNAQQNEAMEQHRANDYQLANNNRWAKYNAINTASVARQNEIDANEEYQNNAWANMANQLQNYSKTLQNKKKDAWNATMYGANVLDNEYYPASMYFKPLNSNQSYRSRADEFTSMELDKWLETHPEFKDKPFSEVKAAYQQDYKNRKI